MATTPETPPPAEQHYVDFDEFIEFHLAKTRSSIKSTEIITAFVAAGAFCIGYLLLFVICDQWLVEDGFSPLTRGLMLGGVAAVSLGLLFVRALLPLLKNVSSLYAAKAIESVDPQLKHNLLNFVDLRNGGTISADNVFQALEKRAAVQLSHVDVDQAVNRRPLLRVSYLLLGIVVVACIYTIFSPKDVFTSVRRALLPASSVAVATQTTISDVTPGETRLPARSLLTVEADIRGQVPDRVQLQYTTADRKYVDETIDMRRIEDSLPRFRGTINGENGRGLLQSLTYRIAAGDARTPDYAVEVIQPPSARVDEIHYTYPSYMQLDPRNQPGGHIDGWEGTTISLSATANMPVKSARILFSDTEDPAAKGEEISLQVAEGTRLSGKWKLSFRRDGTFARFYRIQVTTADGQTDPEPARYTLKVRPDQPPEIALLSPTGDLKLPANSTIPLLLQATDPDFLLRVITLKVEKDSELIVDQRLFEDRDLGQTFRGAADFPLAPLKLKAGDRLQFWIEAKDNKQPTANRRNTPRLNLEIIDPVSAEEARQQLADQKRQQQDQLAQADEERNPENAPQPRRDEPQPDPDQQPKDRQPKPEDQAKPGEQNQPGEQPQEGQPQDGQEGEDGESGRGGKSQKVRNDGSDDAEVLERLIRNQKQQPPKDDKQSEEGESSDAQGQSSGQKKSKPSAGDSQKDSQQQGSPSDGQNQNSGGAKKSGADGQPGQSAPPQPPGASQKPGEKNQPQPGSDGQQPGNSKPMGDKSSQPQPGKNSPQQSAGKSSPQDQPGTPDQKGGDQKGSNQKSPDQKGKGDPQQPGKPGAETQPKSDGGTQPKPDSQGQPEGSKDDAGMQKDGSGKQKQPGQQPTAPPNQGDQPQPAAGDKSATQPNPNPKNSPETQPAGTEKGTGADQKKEGDKQSGTPSPQDGQKPDPMNPAPQEGSGKGEKGAGQQSPPNKNQPAGGGSKSELPEENQPATTKSGAGDKGAPDNKPADGSAGEGKQPQQGGSEKPAEESPNARKQQATGDEKGPATGNQKPDGPAPTAKNDLERRPDSAPGARQRSDDPTGKMPPEQGTEPRPSNNDRKTGGNATDSQTAKPAPERKTDRPDSAGDETRPPNATGVKSKNPAEQRGGQPDSDDEAMKGSGRPQGQKSEQPQGGEAGGSKQSSEGNQGSQQAGGSDQTGQPGQDKKADGATGKPSGEKGPGSQKSPGGSKPSGGKQPGGDQQSKSGKGSSPTQPGGKGAGAGQSPQEGSGKPGESNSGSGGGLNGDPQQPGDGSGTGGGPNQGAGSGSGESDSGDSPDAANLEYARKASNLVLQRLKDQLSRGQVDDDLLKDLGWTPEDMRRFADRLERQLHDPGQDDSPEATARRMQFEEGLKSLQLGPQAQDRKGRSGHNRRIQQIDARRIPVPAEYREQYEAYSRSLSKQPQPKAGKK